MNETVRGYISQFRVRELQAVLEQLGLPKTGRKADLVARVFAFFGEEPPTSVRHDQGPREQWRLEAAERAITYTYQSMMGLPLTGRSSSPTAGTSAAPSTPQRPQQQRPVGSLSAAQAVAAQQAATAAALAHSFRQSTPGKRPGGAASPFSLKLHSDKFTNARSTAIRCVCGDNADRGHMIQCEGDKCGVWQHSSCVGVNAQETPDHFFCEWCRVSLADPFWEPRQRTFFPAAASRITTLQPPAYLTPGERPQPMLHVDRGFTVQPNDSTAFRTQIDIQLQAVCVQLGDPVPFRFHWPRAADLRANNMQYRPYGRNPNNKLGNNARDEPANIGPMCFSGKNRVLLTAFDERRFAFGVQLARKRTQAEVRDMMAPPLDLPAAIAAVKRAVTGKDDGAAAAAVADAGSDSDDLEATSVIMSLRCPLSGSRIVTPARFAGVPGLGCFDLDTYLTMVERSRKWQCPHSMRNMTVRQLHVDTYATRLLEFLKGQPDVIEVEVNADGQWRCVSSAGDGPWTYINADLASVPAPSPVKQEAPDIEADTLSSSDDESEGAELRAAAMAYAASAKRKREPAPTQQDEVIVLSSDSDEEASRPAQRHQTAPPSASQNDNLLRIRLPHRDQQAQSQQRPMQQRTPQSTRQPTVAQAFSRAASHQQSQHQHQGQQPNGLLRHQQPNGWTGASQGARASTPQGACPNGYLAPAAPGSGSGRPDSGGARPPQGMAATSAPQAAVPPPLPQQQPPGQQQPTGVPAHRQTQPGQQGYGQRLPATSAPQQLSSSGPQRPMPQILAHSGAQRSATPGHAARQPPQQGYGLSQQQRQQQDSAWPRTALPAASVPASAAASQPTPLGWVPQSTASAPMQPYSQPQAQAAYQMQRQYQPYAPAQSSAPAAAWQHAASSAAAPQPSPWGWPSSSASASAPAAQLGAPASTPSQALQRPPSQQQQQRAPQRQSTPQPPTYVWGTPESATQPPLPPQPPPPLPGQQPPAPVQHRQSQPQQSQQQQRAGTVQPPAASQQQSGAGPSQPSVHMSPEELAHEAQLAMLPDDMFDEFLADLEFSNALSAQPASGI